jgi:glutaredoxin
VTKAREKNVMQFTIIVRTALATAVALSLGAYAQSNVYKWTDKNGKVHFSDTPPAEESTNLSHKKLGGGYVQESSLPYATQVAMKRNPVVFYSGPKCGTPCERGRDLLSTRGIPFSERDASTKEGAEAMQRLGIRDLPVVTIGERNVKGYDDDAWHAALDGAGYPRTALPGQSEAVRQAAKPPTPAQAQAPGNAPAPGPSTAK